MLHGVKIMSAISVLLQRLKISPMHHFCSHFDPHTEQQYDRHATITGLYPDTLDLDKMRNSVDQVLM